MALSDVNRLFKNWSKYPPLRDLVGFEIPSEPGPQQYMTAEDFKRLMVATGGRLSDC